MKNKLTAALLSLVLVLGLVGGGTLMAFAETGGSSGSVEVPYGLTAAQFANAGGVASDANGKVQIDIQGAWGNRVGYLGANTSNDDKLVDLDGMTLDIDFDQGADAVADNDFAVIVGNAGMDGDVPKSPHLVFHESQAITMIFRKNWSTWGSDRLYVGKTHNPEALGDNLNFTTPEGGRYAVDGTETPQLVMNGNPTGFVFNTGIYKTNAVATHLTIQITPKNAKISTGSGAGLDSITLYVPLTHNIFYTNELSAYNVGFAISSMGGKPKVTINNMMFTQRIDGYVKASQAAIDAYFLDKTPAKLTAANTAYNIASAAVALSNASKKDAYTLILAAQSLLLGAPTQDTVDSFKTSVNVLNDDSGYTAYNKAFLAATVIEEQKNANSDPVIVADFDAAVATLKTKYTAFATKAVANINSRLAIGADNKFMISTISLAVADYKRIDLQLLDGTETGYAALKTAYQALETTISNHKAAPFAKLGNIEDSNMYLDKDGLKFTNTSPSAWISGMQSVKELDLEKGFNMTLKIDELPFFGAMPEAGTAGRTASMSFSFSNKVNSFKGSNNSTGITVMLWMFQAESNLVIYNNADQADNRVVVKSITTPTIGGEYNLSVKYKAEHFEPLTGETLDNVYEVKLNGVTAIVSVDQLNAALESQDGYVPVTEFLPGHKKAYFSLGNFINTNSPAEMPANPKVSITMTKFDGVDLTTTPVVPPEPGKVNKGGCGSSTTAGVGGVLAALALGALVVVTANKRNKAKKLS